MCILCRVGRCFCGKISNILFPRITESIFNTAPHGTPRIVHYGRLFSPRKLKAKTSKVTQPCLPVDSATAYAHPFSRCCFLWNLKQEHRV